MSKEIDTQQTLFVEDSHANHSALQEREKEQTMTATSGMKLLESSESVNLDGSLGKMLKALLTSNKAWSSDRCVMTWKKKVSKSNVLLFQLVASVRGIKGKESGFLHTPTATEIGIRSPEAMERRKKYRESIGRKTVPPGNLLEQIHMMYPTPTQDSASERTKKYKQGGTPLPLAVKMYPTPTVGCEEGGEQSNRVEQTKSGGFVLRKKNKPEMTFGAKLSDAMLYLEKKMYPTPSASCQMDVVAPPESVQQNSKGWTVTRKKTGTKFGAKLNDVVNKINEKPGGKLNPHFVEFLMAYPMNWTKIEPTE